MKKVLSVVLAFAILIVPVGVNSCFADGGQDIKSGLGEAMKCCKVDMMQVIADVNKDGAFVLHSRCFADKGRTLEIFALPKSYYPYFARKLSDLEILDMIKRLECNMARVIFERSDKADGSIYVIFYGAQGQINKFLID